MDKTLNTAIEDSSPLEARKREVERKLIPQLGVRRTALNDAVYRFLKNKLAILGLIMATVLVIFAVFATIGLLRSRLGATPNPCWRIPRTPKSVMARSANSPTARYGWAPT